MSSPVHELAESPRAANAGRAPNRGRGRAQGGPASPTALALALGAATRRASAGQERSTSVALRQRGASEAHEREAESVARNAVREPLPQTSAGDASRLPPDLREPLESRLGADLDGVRLHTDGGSASLADALDADAFTIGRDVYFGAGRYRPDTADGQELIAHELTHVVQQTQSFKTGREGSTAGPIAPAGPAVMARLRFTGTAPNLARVKAILDAGLGPNLAADIDATGNVTLVNTAVSGPPTRFNSEFINRIRPVIDDKDLVTMAVGSRGVPLVGSWALRTIDVADMEALGIGDRGWDSRAALLHEVVEQHQGQVGGAAFGTPTSGAHGAATTAELAAIGAVMDSDTSAMAPNPDGTVSGTRTTVFRYPNGDRWEVIVTVASNNVTNVARRQLP